MDQTNDLIKASRLSDCMLLPETLPLFLPSPLPESLIHIFSVVWTYNYAGQLYKSGVVDGIGESALFYQPYL